MFRSLHTKILAGFLLVIALMGLLGVWTVRNMAEIQDRTSAAIQDRFEILSALDQLDASAARMRSASIQLLDNRSDPDVVSQYRTCESSITAALQKVAAVKTHLANKPDLFLSFEEILRLASSIHTQVQLDPTVDLSKLRGDRPRQQPSALAVSRRGMVTHQMDSLFDNLNSDIRLFQSNYLGSLGRLAFSSQEEQRKIGAVVALLSVSMFLLCILFSIRFSSLLVRPIIELTTMTKRIAAGELRQVVTPRSNDEVGRLGQQFNLMAQKLGEYEDLNVKKILEEKAISESIVQSMDDALVLVDRNGKILSVNRRAQELLGLRDVIGKDCLVAARGVPVLETLCGAALTGSWREEHALETVEYELLGKKLYLTRDVIPIRSGESSETVGYLLLLRNVTASHQLERMRSDFVGMVSHELRTPLTAIRMSVDLLGEPALGPMSETQHQFVEAIHEESDRLLRIVNDLVDLSKMESGKFDIRAQPIELASFFEHLLIPFRASAHESGITIVTQLDNEVPSVSADSDRLKQVFVNLISNALRYTPAGGQITIGVRTSVVSDGLVHFFVRDTGSGIEPEFLPKIFQRFAIQSSDAKSGTGLGLAIAKEIVQAHGGAIEVSSVPGEGTEFWFTIPLVNRGHVRS